MVFDLRSYIDLRLKAVKMRDICEIVNGNIGTGTAIVLQSRHRSDRHY